MGLANDLHPHYGCRNPFGTFAHFQARTDAMRENMIWLFALGIIGFAIYHPGFRRLCFWIGGLVVCGVIIYAYSIVSKGGQL
jgi:hypothetical protein